MTDSPFAHAATVTLPGSDPAVDAFVRRLIEAHQNPDEWTFIPISEWADPHFTLIRDRLRAWNHNAGLMLRGHVHDGTKGTIMRIGRWDPQMRMAYEDPLT